MGPPLDRLCWQRGGGHDEQQPLLPGFFRAGGEPGVKGTLTRNPIFPLYNLPAIKAAELPTIPIMCRFTVDGTHVSTRASLRSSHSGGSSEIVFLFFAAQS